MPHRKLADQYNLSVGHVYRQVEKEMNALPENSWLSANWCNRWCGRLNVDGKYVKVRGYEKKIPFIYGIDFLTHDIPVGILAPSENTVAYTRFFKLLRTIKYPLQIVICDDIDALRPGLKDFYPTVKLQLCHTHYLENVRTLLNIRKDDRYRKFFNQLQPIFKQDLHPAQRQRMLQNLFRWWGHHDLRLQQILVNIMHRQNELFAFNYRMNKCPNTNNIIEAYNSHLQARLKSVKGFQSFQSAERWLNAWMIRRRTKPFTDCGHPFKHLNGKMPLEMSMKKEKSLPDFI